MRRSTSRRLLFPLLLGGGRGFTPLDLGSTLVGWYDASAANAFWQDAGRSVPSGVGDPVYTADDQSATPYHVVQATTANKPTKQDGYMAFGGDDFLDNTSFPTAAMMTAFVVARFNSGGDTNQALFDWSTSAGTNTGFALFHEATLKFRVKNDATVDTGNDYRDGVVRIFQCLYDGADLFVLVNGSQVGTGSRAPHGNTLSVLTVGTLRNLASYGLNGRIPELLVCDSALSSENQAAVWAYLNNKWSAY